MHWIAFKVLKLHGALLYYTEGLFDFFGFLLVLN